MSDRELFEELKVIRDEMLGSSQVLPLLRPVIQEHVDRVQELIWGLGERLGEF